jgi:hypothetical protein
MQAIDSFDVIDVMEARVRLDSEPLPRQELVRRGLLSLAFGVVLPALMLLVAGLGLLALASGN